MAEVKLYTAHTAVVFAERELGPLQDVHVTERTVAECVPDDELRYGVQSWRLESYGDDPDGAYVEAQGYDRNAVKDLVRHIAAWVAGQWCPQLGTVPSFPRQAVDSAPPTTEGLPPPLAQLWLGARWRERRLIGVRVTTPGGEGTVIEPSLPQDGRVLVQHGAWSSIAERSWYSLEEVRVL